ncbi:hypothetical protein EWM64_g784 [Hericium alpestre]|uniref:Mitochondrial import inner membrane translocase subunit TIM50 n=1 Tax=Hericium alpestre TaxID=135208 RepID=A0A4Z0A829_9AGAM|nr:hypothetical protein EWM64_g784 [Hericium alpestre]
MYTVLSRSAGRTLSSPAARHLPQTSTLLHSRALATKFPKSKNRNASQGSSTRPKPSSGPSSPAEPQSKSESTTSTPPPPPAKKETPPPASVPNPASLSLDFSPPEPSLPEPAPSEDGSGSERTGARSSKDSLSSIERKRKIYGQIGLLATAIGVGFGVVYLGRDWDEGELEERKIKPESAPNSRLGRTKERFTSMFDLFSKPQWEELLPPMMPAPYQKPLTLLVSLDDLLVTSTWDRQHGWRTAKRPGVDYFLAYLSQFYEVVIFTTQHDYTAAPVLDKLDPYNFFITYRLYRQGTRASEKGPVKDLTYLNRPLDKVILLDAHPEHVVDEQRDNAIVVPPWKGQPGDRGLVELIPFLESIGIYKPPDVRPILNAYKDKDIPREYALKEAEQKRKFVGDWESKGAGKGVSGFTFSGLFSGGTQPVRPPSLCSIDLYANVAAKKSKVPETYLESKRREAQALYLEEQKYIRENKAEFERLLEQDREAAAREMSGSLWGSMTTMLGGPPPQRPEEGREGAAKPEAAKVEAAKA